MAQRHTKIEIQHGVQEIVDLIIQGKSLSQIRSYFATSPKWGISVRTFHRWTQMATEVMREASVTVTEVELGKALKRIEHLYSKMITQGDLRGALMAQDKINELLELKVQHIKEEKTLTIINSIPDSPEGDTDPPEDEIDLSESSDED